MNTQCLPFLRAHLLAPLRTHSASLSPLIFGRTVRENDGTVLPIEANMMFALFGIEISACRVRVCQKHTTVSRWRRTYTIASKFRRLFPLYTAAPTQSPAGKGEKDYTRARRGGGGVPAPQGW